MNPEWNEQIELPVAGMHSLLLEVVCWDKDRFNKDYMGEFDVPLEDVFLAGATTTEVGGALGSTSRRAADSLQPTWYRLESRKTGRKKSVVTGEILLAFTLYDPVHTSATPQQILQKLSGMAGADMEAAEEDEARTAFDRIDSVDLDEELSDEELPDHPNAESDTNPSETAPQRKQRQRIARLRRKAKDRAYEFSGLSDVAGVLFIEISRASDLPPEKNRTWISRLVAMQHRRVLLMSSSHQDIL